MVEQPMFPCRTMFSCRLVGAVPDAGVAQHDHVWAAVAGSDEAPVRNTQRCVPAWQEPPVEHPHAPRQRERINRGDLGCACDHDRRQESRAPPSAVRQPAAHAAFVRHPHSVIGPLHARPQSLSHLGRARSNTQQQNACRLGVNIAVLMVQEPLLQGQLLRFAQQHNATHRQRVTKLLCYPTP